MVGCHSIDESQGEACHCHQIMSKSQLQLFLQNEPEIRRALQSKPGRDQHSIFLTSKISPYEVNILSPFYG